MQEKAEKIKEEEDKDDSTMDSEKLSLEWPTNATKDLLTVLTKLMGNFVKGKIKPKKRMYELCAEYLNKKGHTYTYIQCENKWKTLKRKYVCSHDRIVTGKKPRRSKLPKPMFQDEIEEILKLEQPSFHKELQEFARGRNNLPSELYSQSEPVDQEYQNYESLEDHDTVDEDAPTGVKRKNADYEFFYETEEEDSEIGEETQERNFKLIGEVKKLTHVIKSSVDANNDILRAHNFTHEQMLNFIESMEKYDAEKIELKKKKIEKQAELVQQMKIQNSLIAKLIQKIDSRPVDGK